MENLELLVKELISKTTEESWFEFKDSNYDSEVIGQDISALANSAALKDKDTAYMIWGIDDATHTVKGTDYNQYSKLNGNEELENWLRHSLSKNADFEFNTITLDGKNVVVLVIHRALNQTVSFKKQDYIRSGSYTKKLNEYPEMQAQLWNHLRLADFESLSAKNDIAEDCVFKYLDFSIYFELKQLPIPTNQDTIFHYFQEDEIIRKQDNGLYSITNLGAILFAKQLSEFSGIARKAVRVVSYDGNDRSRIAKEYDGNKGYAVGFEGLIQFLEALLPSEQVIEGALRKTKAVYPMIALREIIANALMHQDFSISGTGPLVEIFKSRIEVTNPGVPLVAIDRIVDNPPKSRNEKLASMMRKLRMCEELGSGWDRIVISCEQYQLPAPKITLYEENTKITISSRIAFSSLSQEDKLWSCYLHACIKQVEGEAITNSSLRIRFGLPDTSAASISRLIKDALSKKLIKPFDSSTAPRYMKYIPGWA
jgi:ATP-dependent DNA helicase RecG